MTIRRSIVCTLALQAIVGASAAVGILLVAVGVYCVGLERGGSWAEPLRSLARSRASWFALIAALFWSVTSVLHKFGIAEVGALPWAVSVTFGSAILLAALLPWMRGRGAPRPERRPGLWVALMLAAGVAFAVHVFGIHTSLRLAPAGYVIAVSSTGTLMATAFGIVILGERDRLRHRLAGAALVTTGAVLVAALG